MPLERFDHIVLCVNNVETTLDFYDRVLGMERREERPGKWSLHFGSNKISIQDAAHVPEIARNTLPGTGNFCILSDEPIKHFIDHLINHGVEIADGPGERIGAIGMILSVYFYDPEGNLVEVSNLLPPQD